MKKIGHRSIIYYFRSCLADQTITKNVSNMGQEEDVLLFMKECRYVPEPSRGVVEDLVTASGT